MSTLPREAAKLQYIVVRAPFTLIERQVMVRYIADDAAVRLRFERLLATIDTVAGNWLGDDDLSRRGHALAHRNAMLEKATELEAVAEQRKTQADQQLKASAKKAETDRRDAEDKRQANIAAAQSKEKIAKERVRRQAASRAQAEKQQITQQAQATIQQAELVKAAERQRIADRQRRATAAPKQQLSDANRKKQDAASKRAEARRLNALAAKERQQRQASTTSR